ncbi:MAG: MerR family transcriptional regulator [Bacilli bacterium]|nr:MerR family transcriptional regulator [Bacilli bacterium]
MIKIGDFSKLARVTIKALRYYDEIGLLRPVYIDKDTSYRYYETEQLYELSKIIVLRQLGVPLNDIKAYLSGKNLALILEKRKQSAIMELENINRQITHINYLLKESNKTMNYQTVIKEVPECIVYYRRAKIKNYAAITPFIIETEKEFTINNPTLKRVEPNYCYMVYLDDEYKDADISLEYAEAVEKVGNESKNVAFKVVPTTTMASVLHKGSYLNLGDAYAYITNWIKENKYNFVGSPRERYIDGMWNKKSEEEWLTEIQFPIAKRKE